MTRHITQYMTKADSVGTEETVEVMFFTPDCISGTIRAMREFSHDGLYSAFKDDVLCSICDVEFWDDNDGVIGFGVNIRVDNFAEAVADKKAEIVTAINNFLSEQHERVHAAVLLCKDAYGEA